VSPDPVGWASALVLLVGTLKELQQQWRSRSAEGIWPWFFVCQLSAAAGFTVYAALIESWVFFAANGILVLANAAAHLIYRRNARGGRDA
jgi:uncharacterized protein with PQ loop repeat